MKYLAKKIKEKTNGLEIWHSNRGGIMNKEIKEILDWLKDEDIYIEDYGYQYKRISLKETTQLLDYITNLQQENQRLEENNQNMQEEMARVWEENERLKEDKRKAIEYIKENQDMGEWIHIPGWELLNILQNESEEND